MTKPNVFVLSADSLRYDRTSQRNVMPYLASADERGIQFSNAVSNAGFTPGSFPAMVASRYPSSIDGVGIPEEGGVTTLAEELARQGYECSIWSDNKFVGPDYNYDRGYAAGRGYANNIRDSVRVHVNEDGLFFRLLEFGYMRIWQRVKNAVTESHYYDPAATINAEVRGWLEARNPDDGPIHLWVHYMDTHHPYEPPSDWLPDDLEIVRDRTEANNVTRKVCRRDGEDCTDAEIRDAVRLYDAECRYLDSQLQTLVEDYLRPKGWLTEDDVLVITSDHGEIIEEYDKWGEFGHGNYFCEECTRIPLVIEGAGIRPTTVSEAVSLVDLLPTMLDLCDLPSPAAELVMGKSLLQDGNPQPVFYDGTLGFHGARGDGKKRFNDETVGEDTYRNTEFSGYEEWFVEGDRDHDALTTFVEEQLERCRNLADDATAIDPDSLQVEQHMRDLGYLE